MSPQLGGNVLIVSLDGSEFSARAVPSAARLADRLAAAMVFFSAVPTEDQRPDRTAELFAMEPRDHRHRPWVVVDMDPAGAIHEALHRTAGAIACMASHGRNDSAALTGSITTDVIARGHDPLVVVGRSVALDIEGEGVVACIDETAASRASLPSAARMADLLAEPLTVITVAEPVTPPLRPGAAPRRRFGPDEDADRYLDAAAASWRSTGYAVETRAVYDPTGPAAGVLDFLQNSPAALVTVASRARTGTARLRFGSVAAEIVGSVTCPVLVVPRSDAP